MRFTISHNNVSHEVAGHLKFIGQQIGRTNIRHVRTDESAQLLRTLEKRPEIHFFLKVFRTIKKSPEVLQFPRALLGREPDFLKVFHAGIADRQKRRTGQSDGLRPVLGSLPNGFERSRTRNVNELDVVHVQNEKN